ncbi:MAG: hypothetical protein JSU87_00865 [Gemmatimonadota bacterium]|nr:MAG: hypothetical protein JSU87_00865 [Gemmatimonadota bacterium]
MKGLQSFFSRLWKDENAELTVEYGLLVAVLALGLVTVFLLFRDQVSAWFGDIAANVRSQPVGP